MNEHWDNRYNVENYIYGTRPNEFFKEILDTCQPGRLLLPCEGEGRHAVYALAKGWEVVAFDQSEVGRNKALKLASESGFSFRYDLCDALYFTDKKESYDMIALLWAHFPASIRPVIHRNLLQYLKPGGLLVLEGFHKRQMNFQSGGPKDPEMLFDASYIQDDFKDLTTLILEERQTLLQEGDFHKGKAEVLRYVGIKPIPASS